MLVVVLIVIPLIVFAASVLTREINDNRSGVSINDTPQSADGEMSGDQLQENPEDFDFSDGVMKFMFTPSTQTSLDENTIAMLGAFLTSPQNTENAKIAVEIPQLPDAESNIITTAVINALTNFEVPLSKIIFYVYQAPSGMESYELKIMTQ